MPADELDALLDGWELSPRTPYSITDHTILRAELRAIRARGWAENINESEVGIASIGAPIRNVFGHVIASVSIAGPVQRLDGASLGRFARPAVEAAAAISKRMGWRESTSGTGR